MANVDVSKKLPMAVQMNLLEALVRNKSSEKYWSERKTSYEELKKNLAFYLEKARHEIYAPIGKKAFMRGTLVHTNDVTVAIGCGYFLKVSSSGAREICDRRLSEINLMLEKIRKERKLIENNLQAPKQLEAFGDEERKEIVEEFNEEEEAQWRLKHQKSMREHKEKLAQVRNQIKESKGSTEEDLMRHLDLLEMQEELEDEIDRLGGESSEDDNDGEVYSGDDTQSESETVEQPSPNKKVEKHVTFDLVDQIQDISLSEKPKLTAISDVIRETSDKSPIEPSLRPVSKFKARKLNH